MAQFKYYYKEIEADSQRELWIKSQGRVCQANHHIFHPVKRQTPLGKREVDECSICNTVRIPSRGMYPIEEPKSPKLSKRLRKQMGTF
jgi:hypothetical protein